MQNIVRAARRLVICVAFTTFAGAASAQQSGILGDIGATNELRAQQARLFEQLIAEPDNLDMMFQYAKLSIRLEDYEAAISTLERMLIYRQDLFRVRLELGVAYFRLGSYAASELYFDQVLADPRTPDQVKANIKPYKDAIAGRTERSQFSVLTNVGITHATNATQGPASDLVLVGGLNFNLVAGQAEADTGLRVIVNASHLYDLQQPNDDFWRTDFNFFGLKYFDTDAGDVSLVRVRTGPRLSLDEQQFGPKLRPYIEGQYLTSSQRGLFAAFGLGAEYTDTLSPELSIFSDLGFRYRNYFRKEFSDEDNASVYGSAGVAWIPERDVILRGTALGEYDSADGDQNSNLELGFRVSGEYQYDTGISWVDRKWSTSAYVEGRVRFYDEPDPVVDPNTTREDFDVRSGLRQVFALKNGFGVQLDVDALMRESNIINFDLDNISTTLSLQYRM
ncbi:MAG: tetratricopeptide repeat protein [Paracoccaceae bacterium]